MTPEQEERWREAILPMAALLNGEQWEVQRTLLALLPEQERVLHFLSILGNKPFEGWGVPKWASQFWAVLLLWRLDHCTASWVPSFALRSKAALIGIPIRTPDPVAHQVIYQRVFVRFVQEALRPFAAWTEKMQPGEIWRISYKPLTALYYACESFTPPAEPEPWSRLYQRLEKLDRQPGSEAIRGRQLVGNLRNAILIQLNLEKTISSAACSLNPNWSSVTITHGLNRQHQWRRHSKEGKSFKDGPNYTKLIATAYLTALEAECPAPDWL